MTREEWKSLHHNIALTEMIMENQQKMKHLIPSLVIEEAHVAMRRVLNAMYERVEQAEVEGLRKPIIG